MPRHRPPPELTFAAKCCNGWLFMLRGLVMGRVQQVAALHCLSDRRSGIITSRASLHPSPPLYICLSVVLFWAYTLCLSPPRCSLCCEMPQDCSSLSIFLPQMYTSHLGTCRAQLRHQRSNQPLFKPISITELFIHIVLQCVVSQTGSRDPKDN